MNRTKLLARTRKLAVCVLIAVVIGLPVRACIAMPVHILSDAVAPELPRGSWALVYRLGSELKRGDIVAYRADSKTFVARYQSATADALRVSRRGEGLEVPRERLVGKVVLATR